MIKKIAYLSVFTSLIGASVISINLSAFQLSIFRILIILLFFAMLYRGFLRNVNMKLTIRSGNSFSIKFMMIWLFYAIMTLAWVKDYVNWFHDVYFLLLGVICIVILGKIFKTTDDILRAFSMMALMIIIHNIIGWYEIFTGNYMFLHNAVTVFIYKKFHYPTSTFSDTNDFATLMLFSIFILYICIVNSKNTIWKIICISTLISSLLLLIKTSSRANMLGLILAFIVFLYYSMKNRRGRKVILILLILFLGFIIMFPETIGNIFSNAQQSFNPSANTGSDMERTNLLKNGFEFLTQTYGFGTGAGNIEYWMTNYGVFYTGGIIDMHNWWMEILTSYGIVIFILYILFYLNLFRSLSKIYRTSKDKKAVSISLGIMSCMAGFVIGSISSSSDISSEWLWVFWALAIAFQGIMFNKTQS